MASLEKNRRDMRWVLRRLDQAYTEMENAAPEFWKDWETAIKETTKKLDELRRELPAKKPSLLPARVEA